MPTPEQQRILDVAAQRRGVRYRMPPPAPDGSQGLDCSLFVVLTFRDAGIPFTGAVRTAEQLRQASEQVDRADMQTGDLLFFENTYDATGQRGPDGKIATHVGIAIDGTGTQMWDCHASNDNTDLPGVGVTSINQYYWEPKLFDVRRVPGLVDGDDASGTGRPPPGDAVGPRFRVTTEGLRLRRRPRIRARILIPDLGKDSIVTAVDDVVEQRNDIQWRHVRAPDGTVGWAAADYLEPIGDTPGQPPPARYRITANALRMREQPSLQSDTVVALTGGTIVTEIDAQTVSADEIIWRHVRSDDGAAGWMSSGYLERVPD